jgi:sugar-specific transcriptional regulator TrmB
MEERIIAAMKQLGFTTTAARAYVALLKSHPATGYELASRSSVPRSAIYNVLGRLEALGLVNAVQDKPVKYIPLPPGRLFELLESRFTNSLEELRTALETVGRDTAETATWTVQGYSNLLDQALSLINSSKKCVHASLWAREAERLAEPLRQVAASGVEVVLFSFNTLPKDIGRTFAYGIPEAQLDKYWRHKIILISDHERCLVGLAEQSEDNRAVVTKETALVEMATSNLVLDITLYGQRKKIDVEQVVTSLAVHLAPVDKLLSRD